MSNVCNVERCVYLPMVVVGQLGRLKDFAQLIASGSVTKRHPRIYAERLSEPIQSASSKIIRVP